MFCFLSFEGERFNEDIFFLTECFKVSYFLFIFQLWVSGNFHLLYEEAILIEAELGTYL